MQMMSYIYVVRYYQNTLVSKISTSKEIKKIDHSFKMSKYTTKNDWSFSSISRCGEQTFFKQTRDEIDKEGNLRKNVIWLNAIDVYVSIHELMEKFIGKVLPSSSCSVVYYSISFLIGT